MRNTAGDFGHHQTRNFLRLSIRMHIEQAEFDMFGTTAMHREVNACTGPCRAERRWLAGAKRQWRGSKR